MALDDERPPVWVGHIVLRTPELGGTRKFMLQLGMRSIEHGDDFAVLELRGGTHLLLVPAEQDPSGPAPFDLMVDDLDIAHARLRELGLDPSAIEASRLRGLNPIVRNGWAITATPPWEWIQSSAVARGIGRGWAG